MHIKLKRPENNPLNLAYEAACFGLWQTSWIRIDDADPDAGSKITTEILPIYVEKTELEEDK